MNEYYVFFVQFVVGRTTISVESESSVFVCFMNTDCTDSLDFSVSKDKQFVFRSLWFVSVYLANKHKKTGK